MFEIHLHRVRWLLVAAVLSPGMVPGDVAARDDLQTELAISDIMRTLQAEDAEATNSKSWALLPQVGYSPDQGINAGLKFTDRNFFESGLTLDLNAIVAVEGQQNYEFMLIQPNLGGGRLMTILRTAFFSDKTEEFFGLGNNDLGPDPVSTHEFQSIGGSATLAWRLREQLSLAFGIGFWRADVTDGKTSDDPPVPFTRTFFPNLTGIDGGDTVPLSLSLIFNNRKDITRPTRGWSLLASVAHVDKSLGSDFQYTRYSFEASYLLPLLTRRQVFGLRVGGTYIDGAIEDIPFYELAYLGGNRTLRGFFKYRFLGRTAALATAEYRLKLLDFQFFDLWQIRIDGVGFVEGGRVFLSDGDIGRQLGSDFVSSVGSEIRYSYGGGLRFALGQALVARIDAGFSEEESALFYLTFGHTF
nr:BamA/TamA family outer membrane protein [Gammaproteobacteria bacterium]